MMAFSRKVTPSFAKMQKVKAFSFGQSAYWGCEKVLPQTPLWVYCAIL